MIFAKLNNGVEIPMLGLGVFRTENGDETLNSVKMALETGYRHIDTAKMYNNEESVAAGIKSAGLNRKDVFVTSKILPKDIIEGKTAQGFDETLEKLGSDYVDMMLLHFPMLDEMNIAAWKTLEEYYKAGHAKVIGISNYNERQLGIILDNCEIVPAVNQFHIDPFNNQRDRINFCMSKGVYTEAASPFGGTGRTGEILGNPTVKAVAEKLGKSPAQVIIRWNLQNQVIMIPKSVHKERIEQNFNVFDFELSAEDMASIDSLNNPEANLPFMDPEKAYDMWSGRIKMPWQRNEE